MFLLVLLSLCSSSVSPDRAYHFFTDSKSWSEAQSFCREHYTDLATVHNMEDVRRLAVNGATDAWIGLYQTSGDPQDRTWHWSQPGLKYNESESKGFWASGEPTDKGQNNTTQENCVVLNENCYWIDSGCQWEYSFICYNATNASFVVTDQNPRTWLGAQTFCREHHTDLITGLNQLNDLKNKQQLNGDWWWIGLFRDTWGWSDGSDSSFRIWDKSSSVLRNAQGNKCAKLGNQNQMVHDNCNQSRPFICYDDHYILVREEHTWEEAFSFCRQHHRDLAWISDDHEQRSVRERAKIADSEFVWVGLHYTCFLEEWVWVNGRYVSNGNWKDDEPNDCGVSGAMEKSGENKWVKKPSDERFNFICARYC